MTPKTLEAIAIIKAFRASHPAEVGDAYAALCRLLLGLFGNSPELGVAKFESWAQLEWAGAVIGDAAGQVKAQRETLAALGRLLVGLAELAIETGGGA